MTTTATSAMTKSTTAPQATATTTDTPPKQGRFSFARLRKLVKSQKRSNRTAATTSYDDDISLDDFQIRIDNTLEHVRRHKSWNSSCSVSTKSSRRRRPSWRRSRHNTDEDLENMMMALLDMGQAEVEARHEDRAEACWKQAVEMSNEKDAVQALHNTALWNLVMMHCRKEEKPKANAYLNQVDFDTLEKEHLIECSGNEKEGLFLLTLLMELLQWSAALTLAEHMEKESVSSETMSLLRFEVAKHRGSVEMLKECAEDETMRHQSLMALATLYAKKGQWEEALATNASLECTTAIETAEAACQKAEMNFACRHVDEAWDALEIEVSEEEAQLLLLQTEAQLLYKTGRYVESLKVHHDLLTKWQNTKGPICSEVAKTYYTMGRICIKANMSQKAVECFRQELHVTQLALGENSKECSRILHEMARLQDEHLGKYQDALRSYQKALKVEQTLSEDIAHRKECLAQIRETQKCIGRIHYKMGDFGMAMDASFEAHSPMLKNTL